MAVSRSHSIRQQVIPVRWVSLHYAPQASPATRWLASQQPETLCGQPAGPSTARTVSIGAASFFSFFVMSEPRL